MRYLSTRTKDQSVRIDQAIFQGLAPDGGLYVPETLPKLELLERNLSNFSSFAHSILKPFFQDSPLQNYLQEICQSAFNFPLELNYYDEQNAIVELYHGPTCAFKDFGARFLAYSMSKCLELNKDKITKTILVATSGDTGGAVASAFQDRKHINVGILFPKGKISSLQEKQLTCWKNNITSFKVSGNFDDCQNLVKDCFSDKDLRKRLNFSSANSINIGRILPQMAYHAFCSLKYFSKTGYKPTLIIPTGNLGNALGAIWAKEMGLPIEKIVLAVNENKVIHDYLQSGAYCPKSSVDTLANAMDVGNPSNMERLLDLYSSVDEIKKHCDSSSVSDEEIQVTINAFYQKYKIILCPHTAVAMKVKEDKFKDYPSLIYATAHYSKFDDIIKTILKVKIQYPKELQSLLNTKSNCFEIAPIKEELVSKLQKSHNINLE